MSITRREFVLAIAVGVMMPLTHVLALPSPENTGKDSAAKPQFKTLSELAKCLDGITDRERFRTHFPIAALCQREKYEQTFGVEVRWHLVSGRDKYPNFYQILNYAAEHKIQIYEVHQKTCKPGTMPKLWEVRIGNPNSNSYRIFAVPRR